MTQLPGSAFPSIDDRIAIEELIFEHSWLIDHGQADRLADLYTSDGRMLGVGADIVGREALLAWGRIRAAMTTRTSRHVCSNLRLKKQSENRITGNMIVTVYRHDGDAPMRMPPLVVADYEDIYVCNSDGFWRFLERKLVTVFQS